MRTVTGQEKKEQGERYGKTIIRKGEREGVSDQRFVGVPFIEPTEGLLANIRW